MTTVPPPNGDTFTVDIPNGTTLHLLKVAINLSHGIPYSKQRLSLLCQDDSHFNPNPLNKGPLSTVKLTLSSSPNDSAFKIWRAVEDEREKDILCQNYSDLISNLPIADDRDEVRDQEDKEPDLTDTNGHTFTVDVPNTTTLHLLKVGIELSHDIPYANQVLFLTCQNDDSGINPNPRINNGSSSTLTLTLCASPNDASDILWKAVEEGRDENILFENYDNIIISKLEIRSTDTKVRGKAVQEVRDNSSYIYKDMLKGKNAKESFFEFDYDTDFEKRLDAESMKTFYATVNESYRRMMRRDVEDPKRLKEIEEYVKKNPIQYRSNV